MPWQWEYAQAVTGVQANVVPVVKFSHTVTAENYTRNYTSSDITHQEVKRRAEQEITLLEARDRALATFEGVPVNVPNP